MTDSATAQPGNGQGRLAGKVAIVTGAAKGLGEADARLFAAQGAQVVLTDVDVENGERIAQEIGGRFVKHDVRHENEWIALIDGVLAQEGRLDVLVNNAGVVEAGNIETTSEEDYRFVMAVSADGTFFGCKHGVRAMKESGGGSIINMASVASIQGIPAVTAYCAAKGAVESLTRAVAVHCAENKLEIRCNSIHPGSMNTPMVQSMGGKIRDAGLATPPPAQPRGDNWLGLGSPNDIANTALFLASDESRFVTGAKFVVDNAMTIS